MIFFFLSFSCKKLYNKRNRNENSIYEDVLSKTMKEELREYACLSLVVGDISHGRG